MREDGSCLLLGSASGWRWQIWLPSCVGFVRGQKRWQVFSLELLLRRGRISRGSALAGASQARYRSGVHLLKTRTPGRWSQWSPPWLGRPFRVLSGQPEELMGRTGTQRIPGAWSCATVWVHRWLGLQEGVPVSVGRWCPLGQRADRGLSCRLPAGCREWLRSVLLGPCP